METTPIKRRELILEMMVVVFAFVVPFLYAGLRIFLNPGSGTKLPFIERALPTFLGMVTVMPIILYVVWKSGEGFRRFGLRAWRWGTDTITTGVVFGLWFAARLPEMAIAYYSPSFALYSHRIMELNRSLPPIGAWQIALSLVLQFGNAFREEFVLRGYLITRFEDLKFSAWVAVLAPAILFSSYHIYEGPLATISIAMVGIINGIAFRMTRSIWPLVIGHAAWNVMVTLRL